MLALRREALDGQAAGYAPGVDDLLEPVTDPDETLTDTDEPAPDTGDTLMAILDEHISVAERTRATLVDAIAGLATDICGALERGGALFVFGNGGSAADAQHFAAELTGHFRDERDPLPAVALTVDSSALSAIANDYGWDHVYERQVQALCGPHDLVLGISTSGRAQSVIAGVRAARERGARTWALTGGTGGSLVAEAHRSIVVPSGTTARIQEMHITIIHAVCLCIDQWWTGGGRSGERVPAHATDGVDGHPTSGAEARSPGGAGARSTDGAPAGG